MKQSGDEKHLPKLVLRFVAHRRRSPEVGTKFRMRIKWWWSCLACRTQYKSRTRKYPPNFLYTVNFVGRCTTSLSSSGGHFEPTPSLSYFLIYYRVQLKSFITLRTIRLLLPFFNIGHGYTCISQKFRKLKNIKIDCIYPLVPYV